MGPAPREGDRSRWYMLQPYLIALLMSKGIPMLWQGQELAEIYFLPEFGAGRATASVGLFLRWSRSLDHRAGDTISLRSHLDQHVSYSHASTPPKRPAAATKLI